MLCSTMDSLVPMLLFRAARLLSMLEKLFRLVRARGAAEIDIKAPALRSRLRIHARNIDAVHNLALSDFLCRFLPVVPVWITLAERFLIDYYGAVWNVGLDGFGNNPQGAARSTEVSWWDTLHPGRPWADKLPHGKVKTPANARQRVLDFFEGRASE